jgi:hypothetical protein
MTRRDWLAETHGPTFELLRHFLLRFFDSELVTSPGQTALALIGSSSMFVSWFPFVTGPLKDKYARLAALPTRDAYRWALRADELWLIVMMMAAIGLLTAIKWQSLFPSLTDYRATGWLPIRARQIFSAKLAALSIVATAAIIVLNLAPALGFPMLAGSRVMPTVAALVAASYFSFFALVAIQGVLLNLLRPRQFARISASAQALLAAIMLILLVFSFSIGPSVARTVLRPEVARWLPPVWFLGLCDSALPALAQRAYTALAAAVILVLAAYTVSYRRHRTLMMEGIGAPRTMRRWPGLIFDWLVPDAREQAVMSFLAKGISSNGPHRMILMGYGGFGVAIVLIAAAKVSLPAAFLYGHVVLLTFLSIGLRHLFSIPVELRANWLFQLTEREGRRLWQSAVDRFVLIFCALAVFVFPLPLEARWLGWQALAEMALAATFGLLAYEGIFASWEKLPFTCSYLPGKKPMWMLALRLLALLAAFPLVNAALVAALFDWRISALWCFAFGVVWTRLRRARQQSWAETRLLYEDAPDPAIRALNLLR